MKAGLILISGILLGALIAYLWLRAKIAESMARVRELDFRARTAEERLESEKKERERITGEFRLIAGDTLQNATKQLVADALKDFRQVKTESEHAVSVKSDQFQAAVSEMRTRLEETLRSVQKFEDERIEMYGGLKNSIEQMLVAGHGIRLETAALKKALTSSAGTQGNFGQILLEQILEQNGLLKGVGYETQVSFEGDDGNVLRPDVLIHLPGNKKLIVDAKAPVGEFLLAQETDDPSKIKEHYVKLAANLRDNMVRLSRKEYQNLTDSDVRFVLMFVPEGPIRAAFSADPTLLHEAQSRNVLLASPMTIIPMIQLIAYSWQQYRLANNARELGSEVEVMGRYLYTFMEHVGDIRAGIKKAQEGWNHAVGSWRSRLAPQMDKVKTLGAKMKEFEAPEDLPEEVTSSPLHKKPNLLE